MVALGLLLLSGWSWWYFSEITQPNIGWFAYEAQQETDTYWYAVTERRLEFLVVPVVLVLLWAAASFWLLGLRNEAAAGPRD